ncbi:MAG TPA: nuclear transport factor 2 family protein [Thermoanaerobaculia bacterium]|nr:nuclear transport factor 2 family protein [Thermoanaerobaculia bacterium]
MATVLNDWHESAKVADEARYFSHFAPDGVFMGTDATERWTTASFRTWAHPYFARGKAWTFEPTKRHVRLSSSGSVAWFDEELASASYGACRGTGVLERIGGVWKIQHYNLTIPIPNALADEFVAKIRATVAR